MSFRRLILFLWGILLCTNLFAQGFVSLDWKNPAPRYEGFKEVKSDLPGFSGASYQLATGLPCYTYVYDLGRSYQDKQYAVTVEYPEFEALTKKEVAAIQQAGLVLPAYPEVFTHVSVSAKNGFLSASFVPLVLRNGVYLRIKSFKLSFTPVENKTFIRKVAESSSRYADNSVLAEGRWVKIKVSDTGVYKITKAELAKMGFRNPEKVRLYGYGGRLLSENLRDYKIDDLQEIPLWREADYVLFYGYGTIRWKREKGVFVHVQNYFSTYGCYFLTESEQEPTPFPQKESLQAEGALHVTTFPDYALYEKEEFAWMEGGRMLFDGYDYKNGKSKSYTFTGLKGITDAEGLVTVSFSAYDKSNLSSLNVAVDGSKLGTISLPQVTSDYAFAAVKEGSFTWIGKKNTKTVVSLTHERRSSSTSGRLDFIRLNFIRSLSLYDSYTAFRVAKTGKTQFTVANVDANACVWRVDSPEHYGQMKGSLSDGNFSFVCEAGEDDEFVVVNPKGSSFLRVESMGVVPNQNLHQLKEVDMVVITPPHEGLIKQAERLVKAHEEHDGIQSVVLTSEQVYNEFSSGTPDATAFRWLMKMLYDRAEEGKEPKYLLLFGDASFDNRFLTDIWKNASRETFLPCFESENSISKVSSFMSDDYLGMLDDDDAVNINRLFDYAVDIGVGRLPVRTVADAQAIVSNLLDYMDNKNIGSWKNTVAFLGDDGKNNDENIHMEQADAVAQRAVACNPSLLVNKVYWDAYKMEVSATGNSYPIAKERIKRLFKDGLLFFNYTGHGDATSLSDEYVVTVRDLDGYVSGRPPFWFTAACDIAPIDRMAISLGESALLKGAAIGLLSTARTVYPNQNCLMDSVFVRFLFSDSHKGDNRLGDAVRKAKANLATRSGDVNNLQFVFLGDPALRLSVPTYKMVVDEFNGVSAESELLPQIKAGGKVRVKGRVLDEHGQLATDFFGVIHPRVLDSEEKVVTYNNNGLSTKPFEYYDRSKVIFAGTDSVRSGTFDFQFPVPLDINYSDGAGLLNLYAANTETKVEGQGYFSDFLIGGTEDGAMDTDSVGPKINLYLNTPDFISGDKVNPTPYLIAELEDPDGINTVGNGIGHDIVAVIDNSPLYTYVLNNYYEPVFGDYTKGLVRFSFPEMTEGKHTLLFRAWDLKNNSSTVEVELEVVNGLVVGLDITCTKSPARDNTIFILTHDRPYSHLDVNITVFDYAGRTLWTHQESGVAESNYYQVNWDLKTNSGQRLVPGVYLYKATVASDGSKEVTKTRKIVIAGQ